MSDKPVHRVVLIEDEQGFVLPVRLVRVAGPGWCIESEIEHVALSGVQSGESIEADFYKFKEKKIWTKP